MENSNCMIPKPPSFTIQFVDSQESSQNVDFCSSGDNQNNNNSTMDNSVEVTNVIVPDSMTQSLLTEDENVIVPDSMTQSLLTEDENVIVPDSMTQSLLAEDKNHEQHRGTVFT